MITELNLINIRSYRQADFSFSPLTVIVGPNGWGKTNIIEAIFFLSTGRSFRTSKDAEMIQFAQPFGRITAHHLDVTLVNNGRLQKQLRIHQKPSRLIDILGHLPSVLFTPGSLSLVDGSPALRRQYLDIVLSQSDRSYARQLLEYQKVLKQRNELLHQIKQQITTTDSLSMWNDLLVKASVPVIMARAKLWQTMRESIKQMYTAVSGKPNDTLEVVYQSSVDKKQDMDFDSPAEISKQFNRRLDERRPAELQIGRTVVGPHRDDLTLILNNQPVAVYGSRGEQRSSVVALKLFEYTYMKKQTDTSPTLLFDDVFSEFDPTRRQKMMAVMPDAQMIFTATDREHIGELPSHAEVIDLENLPKLP